MYLPRGHWMTKPKSLETIEATKIDLNCATLSRGKLLVVVLSVFNIRRFSLVIKRLVTHCCQHKVHEVSLLFTVWYNIKGIPIASYILYHSNTYENVVLDMDPRIILYQISIHGRKSKCCTYRKKRGLLIIVNLYVPLNAKIWPHDKCIKW